MSTHEERFKTVKESEAKANSLAAVNTLLDLVLNASVEVDGVPLQTLLANRLNLPNPERIAAQREVAQMLATAQDALHIAKHQLSLRARDARTMVPGAADSTAAYDEMH
jgi:hypothetical protein